MVDEYGLGPVQNLERDAVLERAVALVQQVFPGTIEIEDSSPTHLSVGSEPERTPQTPTRASTTTSTPAPAQAPEPEPSREPLLATLKELLGDAFSTGPNRGGAGQWLKARLRSNNVTRLADLKLEDLYAMCQELETIIDLQGRS